MSDAECNRRYAKQWRLKRIVVVGYILKSPKLKDNSSTMEILEIKVLKGPNYWSIRRPKLIQMKLDLEEMEQRPTNKIPGFRERLEKLIPPCMNIAVVKKALVDFSSCG